MMTYDEFKARDHFEKPELLATCLMVGDRVAQAQTSEVVSTVFSGIYGSCLMAEDEELVLKLLHHLMKLQLASATNPRKLIRQGNCAFSRLYMVSKPS